MGVGQRGERLDAARRDNHAGRPEGAAGERSADVPVVVDPRGQGLDVPHRVVGLFHQRALGRAADDQVRLQLRYFPQHLQQPDAVDDPLAPEMPTTSRSGARRTAGPAGDSQARSCRSGRSWRRPGASDRSRADRDPRRSAGRDAPWSRNRSGPTGLRVAGADRWGPRGSRVLGRAVIDERHQPTMGPGRGYDRAMWRVIVLRSWCSASRRVRPVPAGSVPG